MTSLDFQSLDPAPVEALRDRVERTHALLQPLEHLLRGLHRRPGFRNELLAPVFAPSADQLGCHLDLALHAEVFAENERLVRAMRTPGDARRLGRDGEGLTVPVKTGERATGGQPLARASVVFDRDQAPADFLHGVARHFPAQRLRHKLPAEAVAEHRNIGVGRLVHELEHRRDPRQLVVHAHRPAHEREPGELARVRGNRFARVHLDEPVRNAVRVEECGKIARPLGVAMTENRDGFHVRDRAIVVKLLIVASLLWSATGWTAEVSVIGLFPGKAVVVIDGGAPRVLSVGQKPVDGVSLISTDRESATLLVDGEKRTLRIGQHQAGPAPASSSQSATLTADARGHFVVDGQINGGAMRFLVDTGATAVSLSAADASRLGIDYRKGQPGLMGTANGTVAAYRVKLDTVRVGDIVVNNIDAAVIEGNEMPFALLGMSFLNRMEMKREGQTMVLIRRF